MRPAAGKDQRLRASGLEPRRLAQKIGRRIGLENIARYEHDLLAYATERLARIPGVLRGATTEEAGR